MLKLDELTKIIINTRHFDTKYAKHVTAVMRHMLNKNDSGVNESQADFDRDGYVTAKDIIALMRAMM